MRRITHLILIKSISLLLIGLLSACAIADIPTPTAAAPQQSLLQLQRVDESLLRLEGSCIDDPALLEAWLGTSMAIRQNMEMIMEESRGKSADDLRVEAIRIDAMLKANRALIAPDCTQQAHILLIDALERADIAFNSYIQNAQFNIVPDLDIIEAVLQSVTALHEDLIANFGG